MATEGFAWIYLVFFLIIPLSRILPRIVRKWKEKNQGYPEQFAKTTYQSKNETVAEPSRKIPQEEIPKEMSPQTLDMLVLGELNRGTKNFNAIQRNLGIDSKTLEEILESLEKQGLMKVQNKQGVLGPKIELIPTEKGFKKFYS
ncbi:MAG: winged helix-turn-helix transcriptional regulator [Nitrosopumilus sp.]|nr:winged helix-turn-helix transcriptional regulator [Nitrosopumilus sp.]MDH3824438.1 winged helix-turn-helix transcriptional regulator [Nitrosopumilus sp.]